MSGLSKKYDIPESTVKALIKDGWLSCSVERYEEVMNYYNSEVSKTGVPAQGIKYASDMTGYSESMVYYIVKKYK